MILGEVGSDKKASRLAGAKVARVEGSQRSNWVKIGADPLNIPHFYFPVAGRFRGLQLPPRT